jgi:hypothetical protein
VPFDGENFVAVALRHVNEPLPSLREVRPDVSPRLAAAVERALAKDPARRFPSMAALAEELRACLTEGEAGAPDDAALTLITPPAPAPVPPQRVRRRRSRRRPFAWALLALAIAGAAFAAVVLLGGGSHHGGSSGGGGGGGGSGSEVQLSGVGDYDPQGNGGEYASTAPQATDSAPSTFWKTEHYNTQAFGGLKDGLGLVVDAGSSTKLAQLTVDTPTPGFVAEIQVGDSQDGPFTVDSSSQTVGATTTFTLDGKSGQYYVIWITQLPPGLRAEISEVTAKS